MYFNPRTREGCDISVVDAYDVSDMISIHAPVKGATVMRSHGLTGIRYFNPRTREGCDGKFWIKSDTHTFISIHAPVKGATPLALVHTMVNLFQSTHP